MKKKIFLVLAIMAMLVCVFALTVSAVDMASYCSVKLTLTNGEEVTAYCSISGNQMQRDTLYKTPDVANGTYNWEDVVVFDCRDQIIVGKNFPRAFVGTACSALAKNVTTVYLSDYFTHFLNSTFTSDWKSLETVYIPATVTEIKGFAGSPVKNVIIEDNSQLASIGSDAFNGCTQLANIDISACNSLKTIWPNAFRSCTSLTTITFPQGLEAIERNGFYLSGLSGTIVVPNSVTVLKEGAFLATKIETLILGDGPLTIGYNFVGSVGNTYLKNVYIPAEATITETNTFYRCANAVNYYIVGENCDAVVARLLEQQKNNTYATFITADKATESTGAGYGIIHTGYNACEIFYNSVHVFDAQSGAESCIVQCTRCKETVSSGGDHTLTLTEEFLGGLYTSSGVVISSCTVCGIEQSRTEIGVIIECLGYSAPEDGRDGFVIGYTVNNKAIAEYEEATGKTLKYGIFVVLESRLGDNDIFAKDGTASEGVINTDLTSYKFVSFELKIVGFTDKNKDTKLAMGAYMSLTDGEATEYSYIQSGTPAENEKYCFVSYNDIVKKPSTDDEVVQ